MNDSDLISVELVEDNPQQQLQPVVEGYDIFATRKDLIKKHHSEEGGLTEKLRNRTVERTSIHQVLDTVIDEIIQESDNLLGNELVFTKEGLLHDASSLSVKRTDILESLARILGKKEDMLSTAAKVDLSSPVFQVFQQICVDKLRDVMNILELDNELKQLLVIKWGEEMADWDKEMKKRMNKIDQEI